jgi:hypothetical protein
MSLSSPTPFHLMSIQLDNDNATHIVAFGISDTLRNEIILAPELVISIGLMMIYETHLECEMGDSVQQHGTKIDENA